MSDPLELALERIKAARLAYIQGQVERQERQDKESRQAFYLGYDCTLNRSLLLPVGGEPVWSEPQTNGMFEPGQPVSGDARSAGKPAGLVLLPPLQIEIGQALNLQILFSLVEDGEIVFYVGAHLDRPKRLISVSEMAQAIGISSVSVSQAKIANYGGENFLASFYLDALDDKYLLFVGQQVTWYRADEAYYLGGGFWYYLGTSLFSAISTTFIINNNNTLIFKRYDVFDFHQYFIEGINSSSFIEHDIYMPGEDGTTTSVGKLRHENTGNAPPPPKSVPPYKASAKVKAWNLLWQGKNSWKESGEYNEGYEYFVLSSDFSAPDKSIAFLNYSYKIPLLELTLEGAADAISLATIDTTRRDRFVELLGASRTDLLFSETNREIARNSSDTPVVNSSSTIFFRDYSFENLSFSFEDRTTLTDQGVYQPQLGNSIHQSEKFEINIRLWGDIANVSKDEESRFPIPTEATIHHWSYHPSYS